MKTEWIEGKNTCAAAAVAPGMLRPTVPFPRKRSRPAPPWPSLFLLLAGLAGAVLGADPETLSLKQAGEIAIKNHPRITAAELQALAAQQVVTQVRAAFFPTLSANATAVGTDQENTRVTSGGLDNPHIFDHQGDGLILSQLITDFGRTANLTKSSALHARAEEQNAIATRAQILLAADAAYFAVLQAQSVLRVAEQTVATYQLTYDQVVQLANTNVQMRSALDVSFARVDLEKGKILLVKAANDLKGAFATLWTVLGYRDEHTFQLVEEPLSGPGPTDLTRLLADALANRPELAGSRLNSESARRFAKAEMDLNYPTISAVAAVGVTPVHDPILNDHYAAAGVNLNLPIFAGLLYKARQDEAKLLARKADENLRDQENNIIRDVRIAWLNTNYTFERLGLTAKLLESANQAYDLAQARYKVGLSSIVELSQSQLNKTSAEIDQADAKYQYLTQRTLLNFQIGALR
ncbi:MAG: TolC family protein [Limisphaerales bacterium]